jgi:hypothetical protein
MRGSAWKFAIIAIAFCYPVGSFLGRLAEWIGSKSQHNPTPADALQMVKIGNAITVVFIIFGWLVAFIAAFESTQAEDKADRSMGRFSFLLVVTVTVLFLAGFGLSHLVKAFPAA